MAFTGFAKGAMGFWHELEAHMNKEWFDANKARYQAEWVEPFTALLADVGARLATTYKPVKLGAPKVLRIYRDTRFAKDKSPYKTWIGGGVALGGDPKQKPQDGVVAVYAHFGTGEEFVGAGHYVFADDALARWRKKVHDPKAGAAIAKLVTAAGAKGFEIHAGGELARVPKPYAADHPRADLLRMKGLTLGFPAIPRGLIHKPALVDWIAERAKAAAPIAKWLHANL